MSVILSPAEPVKRPPARLQEFFLRAQSVSQTEPGVARDLDLQASESPTSIFEFAGVRCRKGHSPGPGKDGAVYR